MGKTKNQKYIEAIHRNIQSAKDNIYSFISRAKIAGARYALFIKQGDKQFDADIAELINYILDNNDLENDDITFLVYELYQFKEIPK